MTIQIQIQDNTWEQLNRRKKKAETFDDVIQRMILEVPEVKQ